MSPGRRLGALALALALGGAFSSTVASRSAAAPGDPPYSVPTADLAAALSCAGPTPSAHQPVLLVHGTGATAEENWGSNYAHVLPQLGYDTCTVALPNRALGDIQVSAEYVVYAIRAMYAGYGRKVDVLGHSQGPLEPRWALKWWPSLRSQVDHLVMLAAPNHGTAVANAVVACSPACLQMRVGSNFLAALNAGDETPDGVSYTSIYSLTDELVQPAAPRATSALEGATNILMQDVCPGRIVEHVQFAFDAAVFALVMDAFTHPGSDVDPARIDRGVCYQTWFAGVSPQLPNDFANGWNGGTLVLAEPPLASYATSTAPPSSTTSSSTTSSSTTSTSSSTTSSTTSTTLAGLSPMNPLAMLSPTTSSTTSRATSTSTSTSTSTTLAFSAAASDATPTSSSTTTSAPAARSSIPTSTPTSPVDPPSTTSVVPVAAGGGRSDVFPATVNATPPRFVDVPIAAAAALAPASPPPPPAALTPTPVAAAVPATPSRALVAFTGRNVAPLVMVGFSLLLLGASLQLSARRIRG